MFDKHKMKLYTLFGYLLAIILTIYLIYLSTNIDLNGLEYLRKAASECTLFLNKNNQFPIPNPCKVLLLGSGARYTVKGGLGSGDVDSDFTTIEQGLEKSGFIISPLSKKWFNDYIEIKQNNLKEHLNKVNSFFTKHGQNNLFSMISFPEVEYNLNIKEEKNEKSDIAIYVLSRNMGEGADRLPIKGEVFLTDTEINDILYLDKNYKKFMLILNVGGVIDLTPVTKVSNILLLSQLGSVTGDVLSDIILGKVNPSGKLTSTWTKYSDYKFINYFGDLEQTNYLEGIYVGYRYFDSVGIDPLYPFGYGKSYTEFAISKLSLTNYKDEITIKVKVENIGNYVGKEVVQIYISPSQDNADKPFQSLVAFEKSKNIQPGKSDNIKIQFKLRDIARYDIKAAQYILDKGNYIIRVGNSSRDTKIYGYVKLEENVIIEQLKNIVENPGFEDFKPDINSIKKENINFNDFQCIKLTKEDFDLYKTVNYTYIASVSRKLLDLSNKDLIHLCLGNIFGDSKENDINTSKESQLGLAGTTTKNIDSIKKYLTMADGPAGLRLSKVYGIDEEGLYHRMDENILNFYNYRLLIKKPKISLIVNSTKNINITAYPKVIFQNPIAIPIATALAQSFNFDLVKNIGKIIGKEMKKFNIDLWLAPALNIQRNILCGRNFEYFSEDPLISGIMASAIIQGVQSVKNKGTTIKHYAANNQEFNRLNSNSKMSERTLREIYLKGFKIAIEKGKPLALMTSYNLLNGRHTSENFDLIINVLRNEWKYKGLIMTDWSTSGMKQFLKSKNPSQNAFNIIKAGVDIIMPGSKTDYDLLESKLEINRLDRNDLLRCAGKVYETIKLIKGELLD